MAQEIIKVMKTEARIVVFTDKPILPLARETFISSTYEIEMLDSEIRSKAFLDNVDMYRG